MAHQVHPDGQRLLGQHVVIGAEQRPDLLVEVGALGGLADLRRDDQRPGPPGDPHGAMHALVGGHPADEQQVTAGPGAGLVDVQVDAVVDDRGDRDGPEAAGMGVRDRHDRGVPGGLGEPAAVPGERPVDGGHHRRPGDPALPGQQRAEVGVVVDDIDVAASAW